jgi:hypothetical protein
MSADGPGRIRNHPSFLFEIGPSCVKTHTSPKCRKYNSQVRDRVACVQHDLALIMRNLFEMFYARRER